MNEKTTGQLNRLFSVKEQIDFLSNDKRYKYSQYEAILLKNETYPNIQSKQQFQTIIKTFLDNDLMDHITRLVFMIQYTIRRKQSKKILDLFINGNPNRTDEEFYLEIQTIMNLPHEKINNKLQSQSEFIYYQIIGNRLLKQNFTPKKIMDVGCGNGFKAMELGRLFKLTSNNIVCADIAKWFDYDEIERTKRKMELLPITEKGPIMYGSKSIDLITMIHTIHHWCYDTPEEYIIRMKSLHDILSDNGLIVIFEHDMITSIDACILDIEHGLWENTIKNNSTRFYQDFSSKYLNFIEVEIIMKQSGFEMIYYKYYDAGIINNLIIPDKSYLSIYKKC